MLADPGTSVDDAWNTWSDRAAELVFLPLGVRITPVLHSSKLGRALVPTPPTAMRLGRHTLRGEAVDYEAFHGGTRIGMMVDKIGPFVLRAAWETLERGEWGLRFSVVLCVSAENRETVRLDQGLGTAIVEVGGRFVAVAVRDAPVLVTGHDTVEAVLTDLDQNGYFDKTSRSAAAPVLALRFNLEMMPTQRFAAAVADSRDLAIAAARDALRDAPAAASRLQEGRNAGALDAVRDVIGWNTVHDGRTRRPTTAASRIWNLGDAVWFNDQCFAALMAGTLDPRRGRENLAVALANATPQGNIACLVKAKDAWVDRSQAPHGAFVAWTMYLRSRDRSLLAEAFPVLARNQRWWRQHRDPDRRGLVSCGTSDIGDGLYRGTAFAARNESGMDNSATHDEAVYDAASGTLSTFDVGLNAALALDAEMLSLMAAELGQADEASAFAMLAADTRQRIGADLWDEGRGLFANRQRTGGFVRSVSPTSFFPLICGAATPSQAERLCRHLSGPASFGGRFALPNATRDDPAYRENTYWRGRIWPNVNFLVWQGLRRYGFVVEAAQLARQSLALFDQSWSERRLCGENYGAESGAIDDGPGNDPFYTWGALLPLMGVAAVMDVSPWHGWEFDNTGEDVRLGPLNSPAGLITVTAHHGTLDVARGAELLFATTVRGRLTRVIVERGLFSATLPDGCGGSTVLRLGPEMSRRVVAARMGGQEMATKIEEGLVTVAIDHAAPGTRLDCHLAPDP